MRHDMSALVHVYSCEQHWMVCVCLVPAYTMLQHLL
jgi:hypothetical protein